MVDDEDDDAKAAAEALRDVHACIELLLSVSMQSDASFEEMMPHWISAGRNVSPAAALAGMARAFTPRLLGDTDGYLARRNDGAEGDEWRVADVARERVVLALLRLFVRRPDSLTGFQQLVPGVFDAHLALGTSLRTEMCTMLKAGGMDASLVDRIGSDEQLVRQPFFWSAPGAHPSSHARARTHELARMSANTHELATRAQNARTSPKLTGSNARAQTHELRRMSSHAARARTQHLLNRSRGASQPLSPSPGAHSPPPVPCVLCGAPGEDRYEALRAARGHEGPGQAPPAPARRPGPAADHRERLPRRDDPQGRQEPRGGGLAADARPKHPGVPARARRA